MAGQKSVVLVHGAFADGSGWEGVYAILKKRGLNVSIVQNTTVSLADDVAYTKRIVEKSADPVVLVGHSYGGVVITESGTHPNVSALVYIAAFAPDAGESVLTLIANPPAGVEGPPILPPEDGFLLLDREKFPAAFAGDVDPAKAQFMADSQVPWGLEAAGGVVSEPAWKVRPSWYLVAADDHTIPPPAQRAMAERAGAHVEEIAGSHAVYVSNPEAVAAIILKAVEA